MICVLKKEYTMICAILIKVTINYLYCATLYKA